MKISELAELAGVSASTVSKVINGRAGIAAETRRHVEEVLDQNGYFKPLVSTKVSQTIELVLDHIESDCTTSFIKDVSYWVQQAGFALTVTQLQAGISVEHCFRSIIDRNPMGVVIHQITQIPEAEKKLLKSRNIPYVILNPITSLDDEAMWVSIDRWTGAFQMTQYLINMGHTRIGIINGPEDAQPTIARYGGFLTAAHHADIDLSKELDETTDLSPQSGYAAACHLLDLAERPTAIFACNDQVAVGVYRAAYERNLCIPDDLSVVGFEDIFPSNYMAPPLTTVHQPFNSASRKAIEMIIDQRRNRKVENHVVLPMTIVKRESVARPGENRR